MKGIPTDRPSSATLYCMQMLPIDNMKPPTMAKATLCPLSSFIWSAMSGTPGLCTTTGDDSKSHSGVMSCHVVRVSSNWLEACQLETPCWLQASEGVEQKLRTVRQTWKGAQPVCTVILKSATEREAQASCLGWQQLTQVVQLLLGQSR